LIGYWLIGYWLIGYWLIGYWLIGQEVNNHLAPKSNKKRAEDNGIPCFLPFLL
jgi:hypothetical protein